MSHRVVTTVLTICAACGLGSQAIARASLQPSPVLYLAQSGTPTQPQPSPGIQELQSRLTELGYYSGPVDGIFNAETRDALSAFQRDNGLVGTGILDPMTRQRLVNPIEAPAPTGNGTPEQPTTDLPTPDATAAPDATVAPEPPNVLTQPGTSAPLPPAPEGAAPEDLIEAAPSDDLIDESNPLPLDEEGEAIAPEEPAAIEGDGIELDSDTNGALDEAVEETPNEGGLSRILLLGLAIMALGALGTGLVLWLAKRGTTSQAPDETPTDWEAPLEDESVPAYRTDVRRSSAKPQPPSPSPRLQNGQQAAVEAADQSAFYIEHQSLPLDTVPEAKVAKINIIDELIRDLHNPDPAIRHKTIWELGQRGNSAAVQPLTSLLMEADSQEQGLILAALSEISIKTLKPMNRAVALALQDDNPEVRKNAIRDLTRIYDSLGQVGRMLGHATTDSDPEVRQTAQWALDQLNHMRFSANESAALMQESRGEMERLSEDGSSSR